MRALVRAVMTGHVLITGISARAAAASAARAGFEVTALDAFADADHHRDVRAIALPRDLGIPFTACAAVRAARAIACDAVAYLSPLENHARAVTGLARGRALWGNPPDVLRRVRSPGLVADALHRRGLPAPAVLRTGSRPGRTGDWLVKPLASGGGHRIRTWRPGMLLPSGSYLQERIDGVPGSIVFVAAGGRAVPLGVSRQVVGDAAFGSAGYRYCGSILADAGDPVWGAGRALAARALILAQTIAAEFGLAGVNGIDLIVRDGVPLPIEVNPRWCSPVELVERAYGLCAFAAHARACSSGDLSGVDLARAPASASGKAVVFARHGATVGDTRTWCADPTVADVPRPGTRVHAGQPVCTVFATAASSEACYAALVARAEGIYTEMSAWAR